MKNIRKSSIITLLAVFFVSILMSFCFMLSQAEKDIASQAEMQAYQISLQYDDELKNLAHIPTVDEDFDDEEIIIILDSEHSGTELKSSVYNFDEVVAEIGRIDSIDINSIVELFGTEEDEIVSATYRRMLSLKIENPGKSNVIAAIEQLNKLDMVLTAEPQYNYPAVEEWVPTDPYYSLQWGLNASVVGINMGSAWNITKGSGVKVGLFENGIDSSHKDLVGRVGQGFFTPVEGTDLSHGTHVGGIISAVSDNAIGVAGVSEATLHLLDKNEFAVSLEFAADMGIKIINASFYYEKSPTDKSPAPANSTDRQAIENYGSKGGLIICSAGNSGVNSDITPQYPAGYGNKKLFPSVKNVISVGAIDSGGERLEKSNYGTDSVHIYAPGGDILSTFPSNICASGYCFSYGRHYANGYHYNSGTSMAAPHVTGVAALILSKYPYLSPAKIKEAILSGTDLIYISTPEGDQVIRKLNAYKALKAAEDLKFNIKFDKNGGSGGTHIIPATYGAKLPIIDQPTREGYNFVGYYTDPTGGTQYYEFYDRERLGDEYYYNSSYSKYCDFGDDITLFAHWEKITWNILTVVIVDNYQRFNDQFSVTYGSSAQYKVPDNSGYKLEKWQLRGPKDDILATGTSKTVTVSYSTLVSAYPTGGRIYLDTYYVESSCISAGTLITLADGSQVAVEDLTGNEQLLVWNLYTGTFDTAPILFIDSDPTGHYEVINLSFSDGTTVEVISEHGFWDVDLNKYVYLDEYASGYIGHCFLKQGENGMTEVTLVNVDITTQVTTAYSPVTYGHLCYYVNGMLSMPGGIDGLFNIFEVDGQAMMYDAQAMAADIEEYGLYTYEELNALVPVSEEIFDAVNGQYLKIAVGKGIITVEQIQKLVDRYGDRFE